LSPFFKGIWIHSKVHVHLWSIYHHVPEFPETKEKDPVTAEPPGKSGDKVCSMAAMLGDVIKYKEKLK
jgi:hypothetical protein